MKIEDIHTLCDYIEASLHNPVAVKGYLGDIHKIVRAHTKFFVSKDLKLKITKKVSNKELAEAVGTSTGHMSDILNGVRPAIGKIRKELEAILGVE